MRGAFKLNSKKISMTAILTALIMICPMTGCGKDDNVQPNIVIDMNNDYENTVDGSGKMTSKSFDISDNLNYRLIVSSISMSNSSIKVNIVSSGTDAVIEADDNVIDDFKFETDKESNTISLAADKATMYNKINCTVNINAPINYIEADGGIQIEYTAPEKLETFEVDLSGSCSLTASGTADSGVYNMSGSSLLNAVDLKAAEVKVNTSGVSKAEVYAEKNLDAEASGTSSITYYAEPEILNKNASGMASIDKK